MHIARKRPRGSHRCSHNISSLCHLYRRTEEIEETNYTVKNDNYYNKRIDVCIRQFAQRRALLIINSKPDQFIQSKI